jgi:predicted alpha/beta superfamily hydrolase
MTVIPRVSAGGIHVLEHVRSPQRHNERDIHVYVPPSYDRRNATYPVVYMQDGQNLFDAALSFSGEWHVDESIARLSRHGLEAIVVGIPNLGAERCEEYSPFAHAKLGGGDGDSYLAFIADTLKPIVDREFRTVPGRSHTGIMGSSMGGLISLYGFFRRADTFGFAGVMSPSLWFGGQQIFDYVERAPVVTGRVYLDIGTGEGAAVVEDAQRMRDLLTRKGYVLDESLMYVEDAGATHAEHAWAQRLEPTLRSLLPPPA